jgi:heme/copper-type cytochrome/quinol oxidase subunit 1
MGWGTLNLLATCGVALIALSVVIFFVDVARSWRGGEPAGDNPWNAPDLEWRLPSPLPFGNTAPIPVVTSRTPLWTPRGIAGYVRGLSDSPVETLVTSGLDAHPDHRLAMPSPTVWPFVAAAVTTAFFVASIFTPWAVVWGVPPIVIAVTVWFWPTRAEARRHRALEKAPSELPA